MIMTDEDENVTIVNATTVETAKEMRLSMESTIKKIIEQYETMTGLKITDIVIERTDHYEYGQKDKVKTIIESITVDVAL